MLSAPSRSRFSIPYPLLKGLINCSKVKATYKFSCQNLIVIRCRAVSSSSLMFVFVRCHISSKRLECRERRAREASPEHGDYKGQVDPVSETEREKDGKHYSQSSARSGRSRRSSREHQRSRHPSPSSNSVNHLSLFLLSWCIFLCF